jgi:hypothetical protein
MRISMPSRRGLGFWGSDFKSCEIEGDRGDNEIGRQRMYPALD